MIALLLQIVLVADEQSPAAQSLKTLWKERLVVASAPPAKAELVIGLAGEASAYRPLAESGATLILDLPIFAALVGGKTSDLALENPNRLPIDPYDIKTIEDIGREWGEYLGKKVPPSERARAVKAGLQAEVGEPIPSVRVAAADPALRGFAVGDVLPWCGHRKGTYRQRTVAGPDVRALAVSTVNGEAVLARKGKVYGFDLDLEEPNVQWDNRGAFHKWVPVSNLAGRGVRAGRYWAKKPAYAEFASEVRRFAESHPEWALDVVGKRGDDEIHALTLGDATKPLYVFIGMPHAEDEWVPSLGSLSFMELLSKSRELPEVRKRLETYSVKVYPLIHPATYESPMAEPGVARPPDRIDLEKTRHDRAYSITQLHQGGDVLVTACGTPLPLAQRIANRAKEDFAGRHVWWFHHHQKYGPMTWEELAPVAPMPPSWAAYWWQGKTSCYGLYPHDVVFGAKAMWFVEQDFILLMPERFTQSGGHHALHRMFFEHASVASLLLTDQTANWCMSILLTDHAGEDRDAAWRPERR